jgi:replicative DNA helicase
MIDYCTESEQALLAIAMNHPATAADVVADTHAGLFNGKHKVIYTVIKSIVASGYEPDLLTVAQAITDPKVKAECAMITSNPATPGNMEYHIKQVTDRFLRVGIHNLNSIIAEQLETRNEPAEMLTEIERVLLQIQTHTTAGYINSKELSLLLTEYLERARAGQVDTGYKTGLLDLDGILGGLRDEELLILGARPSIGKTAFMVQIAYNLCMSGCKVGIFSAEMSALQIGKRLVAVGSGESIRVIEQGGGRGFKDVVHTIMQIGDSGRLFVNDSSNIMLNDLIKNSRTMKRKENIDVIFVDYISLITHENGKMANWEKIGDISKRLKQLARELHIPVVALSQVTRESEGKPPTLADLRYSGSIEQDADVILFLHRDREVEAHTIKTQVIVAKNRNGEIGQANVLFLPSQTKFVNEARYD